MSSVKRFVQPPMVPDMAAIDKPVAGTMLSMIGAQCPDVVQITQLGALLAR